MPRWDADEVMPVKMRQSPRAHQEEPGGVLGRNDLAIGALLLDRRLASYCARAFGSGAIAALCDDTDEVCSLSKGVRLDAVVVTACDERGKSTGPHVQRIVGALPEVPVIMLAEMDPTHIRALVSAARFGISDVVLLGHDNALTVARRCVDRSKASAIRLHQSVMDVIPPGVRAEVLACVCCNASEASVSAVAQSLGITRRTLAKRLAEAHLPPAGALISWGRLLAVAGTLSGSSRSLESLALAHGFGSASALHNLTKRYLSVTPTQIRRCDGVELVGRELRAVLSRSVARR